MVLAAGLGTRLRPLTNAIPKPLLPFGDRPLIEHAFRALNEAGLGAGVVVNTHHLPEAFERARPDFSLDVVFSHEPSLRGTGGGIAGARPLFEPGPVFVMTSDVVLEAIPSALRERANDEGGMVLAVAPRARGTGTVGVGASGQVVRLRGRLFGEEVAGGEYVGLMALGDEALAAMPEFGCYVQDYAIPHLARGGTVHTVPYTLGFWIVGDDVRSYFEENLRWLERERRGESFIGQGAAVGVEVELAQSIVGKGARLDGRGTIARSLVFPEARCTAPLSGALVSPSVTLQISSFSRGSK